MPSFKELLLSPDIFIHIGSFFLLLTYMLKDFMKLRLALMFANVFFLLPVIFKGEPLLKNGFWALLFIIVNAQRLYVMYVESRPAKLTKEEKKIYDLLFSHMKPKHFQRFFRLGKKRSAEVDETIVKKGEPSNHLLLILSGEAKVLTPGTTFFLWEGQFMAEMGFISGEPASANVAARQKTTYLEWTSDVLKKEFLRRGHLESEIQAAIGIDLIRKLRTPHVKSKSITSKNQVDPLVECPIENSARIAVNDPKSIQQ